MRGIRPEPDADLGIAAIYQSHYRSLAQIAALLLGDREPAEGVVQDAFVALHHAWPQLRDGQAALDYLRRAVVRGARARRTAAPRRPPLAPAADPASAAGHPAEDPASAGGHPAAGPAAAGPLVAALRNLPASQREALVLTFLADWPASQTAAAMGISRHALKAHLHHGLAAVRASVTPDQPR